MGCGTSKEAVVSSDGSGRCSRKLFRRKSSVVATGAHQPVAAAAKDNGDVAKHHKEASAPAKAVEKGRGKAGAPVPVAQDGDEVASTVIAARVVVEKKAVEEIEKDGEEAVIAGARDAKEKETTSGEIAGEKKDESVSDKEVVADQIKDDVASATAIVVIVEEEEEGTENGEPVEVSIVADERDDEEGVSWTGANDEEGWSSEKDIEEIAVEEDDSTVTFADAPVGVATVEDDGVVISADAPLTEEDGDDGSVDVVAAPVAKEDELVSFASAPLVEEVDAVILPTPLVADEADAAPFTAAPVADEADAAPFTDSSVADEAGAAPFTASPVTNEADAAPFTASPVAKPIESFPSIDAPVAKENERVTVAATPAATEDEGGATVDAAASTTANEDEGVMSMDAPASTEDEGAPTVDAAALTTTNEDETVTSPVAPATNMDESVTPPAAAPVSDEEVVQEAETEPPVPSGKDDDSRNDQDLPEPTVVEEAASKADDETEQAKEPEEVVTAEETNVEQEEVESVAPAEPKEEATSPAAGSREDDGESDGKQAVGLNDAANTDQQAIQGEDQLSVEEKKDQEEPAVAPIESSLS